MFDDFREPTLAERLRTRARAIGLAHLVALAYVSTISWFGSGPIRFALVRTLLAATALVGTFEVGRITLRARGRLDARAWGWLAAALTGVGAAALLLAWMSLPFLV